jgi:MFS family permease
VLYETALGVGIAMGPLLGGILGEVSWRGPFFGVSALMAIALIATVVLVERGLPALMDASASQELMRQTSSNVLIVNPAAPPAPVTANGSAAVALAHGSGSGSETV